MISFLPDVARARFCHRRSQEEAGRSRDAHLVRSDNRDIPMSQALLMLHNAIAVVSLAARYMLSMLRSTCIVDNIAW